MGTAPEGLVWLGVVAALPDKGEHLSRLARKTRKDASALVPGGHPISNVAGRS